MTPATNEALNLALEFVQHTGSHLFLTGKAGTGKTTFLHSLKESLPKRMIVTAPTGVAAINAGGVTIHAFFQLPFGPQVLEKQTTAGVTPQQKVINKFSRDKVNILRSLDLLVIDEISMVRADLLDAVDRVLRRFRNKSLPFGGVQLLMIGDLHQLAPVVKEEDWELLKNTYDSPFFFDSKALQKAGFVTIELQHIYRQSDQRFIRLLNKIRENCLDQEAEAVLNSRYQPLIDTAAQKGSITLTTHNHQAARINAHHIDSIPHPGYRFTAEISGDFPPYSYPNEATLLLKPGAQVMFVKNDASKEKRYYNGKIGTITDIEDGIVTVECPGDPSPILTEPIEWHNYVYTIDEDTEEIVEKLVGTFTQIPLKPAWAITIHKSQGLTFDNVIIDAGAAFAHGQVYVALSRCRTLEGVILRSRIEQRSLRTDSHIQSFLTDAATSQPDTNLLEKMKQSFELGILNDLTDFSQLFKYAETAGKLLNEHKTVIIGYNAAAFNALKHDIRTGIIDVATLFQRQLTQLFNELPRLEENPTIIDRLCKGSQYFYQKLEVFNTQFLELVAVESDNKAINKSLDECVDRWVTALNQKLVCLKAINVPFNLHNYLTSRAKSNLESSHQSRSKSARATTNVKNAGTARLETQPAAVNNPALYASLKAWRNETAKTKRVPVYVVAPTQVLIDLSNTCPVTHHQLKGIKGMGAKKIQFYGHDMLAIIHQFLSTNPPE